MSTPLDIVLYKHVIDLANKKFVSKTGVYRSSWIVQMYKKLGGKYKKSKNSGSVKSGLKRWYAEQWVDLNRPIRDSKGKIISYNHRFVDW